MITHSGSLWFQLGTDLRKAARAATSRGPLQGGALGLAQFADANVLHKERFEEAA